MNVKRAWSAWNALGEDTSRKLPDGAFWKLNELATLAHESPPGRLVANELFEALLHSTACLGWAIHHPGTSKFNGVSNNFVLAHQGAKSLVNLCVKF